MNINVVKNATEVVWEILIGKEDLLENIKAEIKSNISKGLLPEVFDITSNDDSHLIRHITMAISDLLLIISRYLVREFSDFEIEGTTLTFALKGSESKDNGVAIAIGNYIEQYIIMYAISQWIKQDTGTEQIAKKIREGLNFRNRSIARPLRPLL